MSPAGTVATINQEDFLMEYRQFIFHKLQVSAIFKDDYYSTTMFVIKLRMKYWIMALGEKSISSPVATTIKRGHNTQSTFDKIST